MSIDILKNKENKKMKKIIAGILSAAAIVALCVCMTACSSGIVGTYKFRSMSMKQGGVSVEIKAGESYMGVTVTEDAYQLTVKDDNTFELKMNMGTETTQNGTWEQKDGKYYFTANGESVEITLNGNTLIFEQEGSKFTFIK